MSMLEELAKKSTELFSLPNIYLMVREVIQDPDSSMDDLADVLMVDPGLVTRLLRIANSSFFGFPARVETLSRAVNLIGQQQIHDLVLATSVTRAFRGMSCDTMNMGIFWSASVERAISSRFLANHCNILDSERIFVEGLLLDIGHLALHHHMPDKAQQALQVSIAQREPLYRVERELIGFNYAELGFMLAQEWNLPMSLQSVIRYHNEPAKADEFQLETSITHIAHVLTGAHSNEQLLDDCKSQVAPIAWQITKLSPECCLGIKEQAQNAVAELVELFLPRGRVA